MSVYAFDREPDRNPHQTLLANGTRAVHPVLALQGMVGNQAVGAMLRSRSQIQATAAIDVQRCGAERHPGCPCADEPTAADAAVDAGSPTTTPQTDHAGITSEVVDKDESVQRKPVAKGPAKPARPKLGACTPVQDDLKPSRPWSELQKDYKASCGSTLGKIWDDLSGGKVPAPTSETAKGAIDCACVGPPEVAAQAAKARLAVAGPLSLSIYDHFLGGSGADWTIDVADMLSRDGGVRAKISAGMKSGALSGTTRIEQSDYKVSDFQFAYGAIDCVQWVITLPMKKKRSDTTPVKISMLDYYEFHPGRPGVSQCAHAACVELVARGSAKNFWTKGKADVTLGDLKP